MKSKEKESKFRVIETPKEGNIVKHPTARNYVIETMEEVLKVAKEQLALGNKPQICFSIIHYENGELLTNRGVDEGSAAEQFWALTHGQRIIKGRIYEDAGIGDESSTE